MNYNNVNVDYSVLHLSNECILLRDNQLCCSGLDFSQLNCIILYLCCSWIGLDYLLFFFFITIMSNIVNNIYFFDEKNINNRTVKN